MSDERNASERRTGVLRVTAVALVGYEHDYLDTIIREWLSDGFRSEGDAEYDFAHYLLAELSGDPSPSSHS